MIESRLCPIPSAMKNRIIYQGVEATAISPRAHSLLEAISEEMRRSDHSAKSYNEHWTEVLDTTAVSYAFNYFGDCNPQVLALTLLFNCERARFGTFVHLFNTVSSDNLSHSL